MDQLPSPGRQVCCTAFALSLPALAPDGTAGCWLRRRFCLPSSARQPSSRPGGGPQHPPSPPSADGARSRPGKPHHDRYRLASSTYTVHRGVNLCTTAASTCSEAEHEDWPEQPLYTERWVMDRDLFDELGRVEARLHQLPGREAAVPETHARTRSGAYSVSGRKPIIWTRQT